MTQLRGRSFRVVFQTLLSFLSRLWSSQTQACIQMLIDPWHSRELIQRDGMWDESVPHVPDVLPSPLSPDCHHCVLVTLPFGLRRSDRAGMVCSPAWPQVPHKAALAERINMEAQMLVYIRWICIPALSYGSRGVRKPGNSAELWSDTCYHVALGHLLLALPSCVLSCLFLQPKKLSLCKYRNSDLFKVLL